VFWPQLAAAAIGLGSVVALIALISNDSKSAIGKAVLGAVGVAGLSAATVTAKLKSAAQALFTRLRQDVYTDLVAEAVTTIRVSPARPKALRNRITGDIVTQSVKQRAITPATRAP
jgi:ribosomal protein S17E